MMLDYEIDELVRVAKRENNTKRPYLFVNPLQGKHIPANPEDTWKLFQKTAEIIERRYSGERLMIIGFAETATAIGTGMAVFSPNVEYFVNTTREKYDNAEYLYFTESHSHAAEQSLIINGFDKALENINRIIFAEDEVTTGNTICKLIEVIKKRFPDYDLKFGIISLLNSMTDERISELEKSGIRCDYVRKIPFEYNSGMIDRYNYIEGKNAGDAEFTDSVIEIPDLCNSRFLHDRLVYTKLLRKFTDRLLKEIPLDTSERRILILGTEEFMFPALSFAELLALLHPELEIRFHATTRSPIMVSRDENYPLFSRYRLPSFYDNDRTTYIYNLSDYDKAIVITDSAMTGKAFGQISQALRESGCGKVYFVRWKA